MRIIWGQTAAESRLKSMLDQNINRSIFKFKLRFPFPSSTAEAFGAAIIIIMSLSSLPKIKIPNNAETNSQSHLKFKKLNTSESVEDIRQRFSSVKTERLNSLERYSTTEEQREYKREKIHLNLLERKLMAGTYDETQERARDLNELKHKTDHYRTQAKLVEQDIAKIRLVTEELKRNAEQYASDKDKKEDIVHRLQRKCQRQKLKTESALYERASLDHMIATRKSINLSLQAKINMDKLYLGKLQSSTKIAHHELREYVQQIKNSTSAYKKLSQEIGYQSATREREISQKLNAISKRKQEDKLRDEKSKDFKKGLDDAEIEAQIRGFKDLYTAVVANIFARKYACMTKEALEAKYQQMEIFYDQIASYHKFEESEPGSMPQRFKQLLPEEAQLRKRVEQLEKIQLEAETRNKQLSKKYDHLRLNQQPGHQNDQTASPGAENEPIRKDNAKQIGRLVEQTAYARQLMDRIAKWAEKQSNQFEIASKQSQSAEVIALNLTNLLRVVQHQKEVLLGKLERRNSRNL